MEFGGWHILVPLRCSLCSTYTGLSSLRTVHMCVHLSAFALAIPPDSFTHVFCRSIQISPPITSYCFSSQQVKPSKNDYLEMAEMLLGFIYLFRWHQLPGGVRDTVVKGSSRLQPHALWRLKTVQMTWWRGKDLGVLRRKKLHLSGRIIKFHKGRIALKDR